MSVCDLVQGYDVEEKYLKGMPRELKGLKEAKAAFTNLLNCSSGTEYYYNAYSSALRKLNLEHDKFKATKCAEEEKKRAKEKRAKEAKRAEEAKRKAVLATLPSKQKEYSQFIRKILGSFLTTVSFGECKETEDSVCFEYKFGFTWRFSRESANYILKLAENGTPIGIVKNVFQ